MKERDGSPWLLCVWLVWESGDAVYLQGRREMSGRKVKLWERMD